MCIENGDCGSFYENIISFKKGISSNGWIEFTSEHELKVTSQKRGESFEMSYLLKEMTSNSESIFVLVVDSGNIDQLEKFERLFIRIAKNLHFQTVKLLDGISKYYSKIAYSTVHEIENEMRAIITEFMCKYAGKNWISKNIHPLYKVDKSLRDKELENNFLYNRNFDQLSKFLFDKYSAYEDSVLFDRMKQLINSGGSLKEIEEHFPKSNWDQFFKDRIKDTTIESKQIQSVWSKLYEHRNAIAHCNTFTKKDYDNFLKNVKIIKDIIAKMVDILENSVEENPENFSKTKELENHSLSSLNVEYKEFISKYNEFSRYFESITAESIEMLTSRMVIEDLDYLLDEALKIKHFKEKLIFQKSSTDEIYSYIDLIDKLMEDTVEDETWDTLLVPARKEGFERVFLGEKQWYDVRINDARKEKIKYIAAYQTSPISAITHWAEVAEIVHSDNKLGYKKILFKNEAKALKSPVLLDKDNNSIAPQNNRYVSLKQIKRSKFLSEVL